MHAAAEILDIGRIGRGGAGLLGVGPGLLICRLAGCFVERDDALARLRYVGAGAEVLQICRIGGDGAGLLGVGPGLLICRLAGCFVERDDALARLRYVGAGAEVLQICRIGGDGAGLLGIGPGLLVGVLARLLIRPLLLLLCLLRIRGLAASRREGSRGNDCNDRQFRKCDTSSVLGLLTPITAHAWPFPGVRRGLLPLSAPTYVSPSICPETAASSKMACRQEIRSRRDSPWQRPG